ncbi:hypothetical protein [Acinetobacter baumannii]|uniref:hypothetical protein n=1 Tax=Acinetobacter baumannii TaxID=470 RepID=UPI000A34DBAA|nr:hypothetical protein [Acinetobacter baumannii]OTK98287.1 hypothetical protein B9X84_12075 [Acinetobacter baumannii]
MSNTQTYGNNNGVELFLVIVGIVMVACLFAIWKATKSLGLDMWTGVHTIGYLIAWLTVVIGIYKIGLNVPNKFLIPVLTMMFFACFFPVLNDYALQASTPSFHMVPQLSYLPEESQKMEFGATKITVWWGMWYAKVVYLAIAGLIGVGIQKAFFNND